MGFVWQSDPHAEAWLLEQLLVQLLPEDVVRCGAFHADLCIRVGPNFVVRVSVVGFQDVGTGHFHAHSVLADQPLDRNGDSFTGPVFRAGGVILIAKINLAERRRKLAVPDAGDALDLLG